MRPKFLAVIFLSALGLLGMIALVERGLHPQPVAPAAEAGDGLGTKRWRGSARASNELAKGDLAGKLKRGISAPSLNTNGGPSGTEQLSSEDADTAHEEYVRQRIDELDKLAREKGADSLNAILLELQNPDKEIRKGALEATIQFRDRSSIPRLQEIATNTEDPKEKVEILEAIEYLKLPTLTEYLAKKRARTGNANPPANSSSLSNP